MRPSSHRIPCGAANEETDTHTGTATGGAGVAPVTGAGAGIDRAVAVELAAAGWPVALAGRKARTLEETAAPAPGSFADPADVTRPDEPAALPSTRTSGSPRS
ncbi:hypothetical protein [Actinacidiphila polyblastidii]|uniref:hypothetical protein n=1 Tax=Actinacidiphila polyblastidii TaxID=3110430 RepID=UPI0039BCC238